MWQILDNLAKRDLSILDLFDQDPNRADELSVAACDMRFDYAKTSLDNHAVDALLALADAADWQARRDAMFAGEKINTTEGRAVLHTALRNMSAQPIFVDGVDVMPGVRETLARMETFADQVRSSDITDVVNIGIGGSDLGPAMATRALSPYHDGPRTHFVANVDAADIADTLNGLDARRTLIIVASKTFTTIETLTNAKTARDWMVNGGGTPQDQFAALSSALENTSDFGIPAERVFGFEDWVGGRYSVWGPIGLSLMIAIGPVAFRAFLTGAHQMDQHFQDTTGRSNMPLMLALVGIWHAQVCGYRTRAILPYDQRLGRLPAYLQQLEMESNGKRVRLDGTTPTTSTGPIVWGEPGTNGQHAFYQLIHQGTQIVPCEFLVAANGHEPHLRDHHDLLIANCLAQSEALMRGRSLETALEIVSDIEDATERQRQARHRVFPGNRPSTTLLYPRLDPRTLGKIIALYEHRVFVEGTILGINSFDQWGVELGKELASALRPIVTGEQSSSEKDSSTKALVAYVQANRDQT